MAGRQGVRNARRAGPRERRAGAAAHVGDGARTDDRRRAGQRGGGVRLVAAVHVLRRPRGRRRRRTTSSPTSRSRACRRRGRHAREVPELSAVTPIRGAQAQVDGDQRRPSAPPTRWPLEQLIDIDLIDGSYQAVADGGVLVNKDPAEDLGLDVGDTVPMTFQNGTELDLTVVGIFDDTSLGLGNWLVSLDTLDAGHRRGRPPRLLHRRQAGRRRRRRSRARRPSRRRWRRSRRPRCRATPSSGRSRRARSTSC